MLRTPRYRCALGGALLLVSVAAASQDEGPTVLPGSEDTLPSSMRCPVEGHEVVDRRFVVEWRGRRYYLGTEACRSRFMEDPETFAREIEPRAALFRAQDPSKPSYGNTWLALGVLVVLGLVSGGVASYIAVAKGLPPVRWFAVGFLANVAGVLVAATRKKGDVPFEKDGLAKMPSTHAPTTCGDCGRENHPSAEHCSRCGAELQPSISSEASGILRVSR